METKCRSCMQITNSSLNTYQTTLERHFMIFGGMWYDAQTFLILEILWTLFQFGSSLGYLVLWEEDESASAKLDTLCVFWNWWVDKWRRQYCIIITSLQASGNMSGIWASPTPPTPSRWRGCVGDPSSRRWYTILMALPVTRSSGQQGHST